MTIVLWLASALAVVSQPSTSVDANATRPFSGPEVEAGPYDVLLGRPTERSVALSILAATDLEVYVAYGGRPGVYTALTETSLARAATPTVITLQPLDANQQYYYRVYSRSPGETSFKAGADRSFHTQRAAGESFTFLVEADPHYLDNQPAVWQLALQNMLADSPDFLIDLGDLFMGEKYAKTNPDSLSVAGLANACRDVRQQFFSLTGHSIPLFLVNGNHDPELGWSLNSAAPTNNSASWAALARQLYYPCPIPGKFFGGSTEPDAFLGGGVRDAYYAFRWGDALFVMLDTYWYSWQGTAKTRDSWGWTLGFEQYQWLKRTLETSAAKYKFVFAHHLTGGSFDAQGRGGLSYAPYFEWGGRNADGTWGFDTHRPGWAMPIQSLLLTNRVTAVFHGHDHLFAKEDLDADGDGRVDLVYQECPQPSRSNYDNTGSAAGYGYTNGAVQGSSGYLRVRVSATNTSVDYVRVCLPADETSARTNRMVSYRYKLSSAPIPATGNTNTPFPGSVILTRPTDHSITASILATNDLQVYLEYGLVSGVYSLQSPVRTLTASQPLELVLEGLSSNTRYFYRLRFKTVSDLTYHQDVEHTFHTQRPPGSAFTFEVQGDSHPERPQQFSATQYANTLRLAAADQPDFYICMGDDFSVDHIPPSSINADLVSQCYLLQRPFLGQIAHSSPLFLVNGNHEQGAAYLLNGSSNSVAVWVGNARNRYFPMPGPDGFYSSDAEPVPFIGVLHDYYAWTWGDALFVTLDPYWHSAQPVDNVYGGAAKRTNWWDITHGETQYNWLKRTLEQSQAKYKFVFAHHVLGSGRGGADEAGLYEWGGGNANGSWGFTANRPTWPLPIHQLMRTNHVTAFIQGHDHLFAHQELDGIAYLEMPEPGDPAYALYNADDYQDCLYQTNNTGRVRFTVAPDQVKVEYVRSYLPQDEGPGRANNQVDYSLFLKPFSSTNAALDTVGDGIPDQWRRQYFVGSGTTTNSISCATCDPDDDGMGNLEEYVAGTDPTSAASDFRIDSIRNWAGVTIAFRASRSRLYSLLSCTNPASDFWTGVPGQIRIRGTGGVLTLAIPSPADGQRFYRIAVELP